MRKFALLLLVTVFLISCVSSPEPDTTKAETASSPSSSVSEEYKSRAQELVMGTGSSSGSSSSSTGSTGSTGTGTATTTSVDLPPPAPGVLTPEEEAYLNNYLARLQYMVYYDENAKIESSTAKVAVTQANRYLLEVMGLSVVDFDQVEKNKKDQMTAYQVETGGSIDILQYLAQKYNADVYVELDFTATSRSSGGRYYASAHGSMKLFDTSTAQLLGSVPFQSPEVMNTNSEEAAATAAIAASVWNAMPKMIEQSKSLVRGSLSRGIRYEVIIQTTPDSRAISRLRQNLARKVREVEQISYSPAETKLAVYSFSNRDRIEDYIYDAADSADMYDIYLVFSRGKSFTFNSGL